MELLRIFLISCVLVLAGWAARQVAAQNLVYAPRVRVTANTRLDWLFPYLHDSPATVPDDMLAGYSVKQISYEFFGPPTNSGQVLPLVIFISPTDKPVGWEFWRPTCQRHGVIFAGVRGAGNRHPPEERIRSTIEVLGDVRRRFDIDTDRTYIAGFSGGGQIACTVGFHLPEYFGGVVCLGAFPNLPTSPWLVDSVGERLSVVTACGSNDPASLFAELLAQHELTAASVRSHTHVSRGKGHQMLDWQVLESAFSWLEEGVSSRRQLAQHYPATRISDTPSRSQWARRIWDDANRRLKGSEQVPLALHQLQGIIRRWPDLPIAATSMTTLEEYESKPDHPWEQVWADAERQRKSARATGYEQLALHRSRRMTDSQRSSYASACLALLSQLSDQGDAGVSDERIAALREVVATAASSPTVSSRRTPIRLKGSRFELLGTKTRWDALVSFTRTLERLGYDVTISAEAVASKPKWTETAVEFDLKAASFDRLVATVLTPMDLTYKKSQNEITILPR